MGSFETLALSPRLPVEDLLAHPEGGADAAGHALTTLLPGATYTHTGTVTWAEPGIPPLDTVCVSTFGETTMFLNLPGPRRSLVVPEEMTAYSLSYQSVSMAWGVDVMGPDLYRLIALSPGALDYAEGAPLPFEAQFTEVAQASAAFSFDDDGFAAAAARWMFGCHPYEPSPGDRVDLGRQSLHTFTPAPRPDPEPEHAEHAPEQRPGRLRRLFRGR